jgi:hypothetical protein
VESKKSLWFGVWDLKEEVVLGLKKIEVLFM